MRVLFILPSLSLSNGVASFAMNYFRNIDRDRVHIDFAILFDRTPSYADEIKSLGSKIFVLPSVKHITKHFEACRRILHEGNYDIIHDNSLIRTIPMMITAKSEKIPIRILHSHSSKMGETPWKTFRNGLFLPLLKAQMTYAFTCSELAGRAMFGNKPFTLVPNVIDADRFRFDQHVRERVRAELDCTDKYIIGSVGRLAPPKNPFFAMDVFKAVHELMPDAEYWWIGTGNLDAEVKAYADKLGLHECVRFLGNRNDVNELYQAMDVFFMPSNFEGFPIACIEAEASGLNCIVSSEITKEINVTEQVQFVSLQCDIGIWAKKIMDAKKTETDRDNCYKQINNSLFSCNSSGDYLTRIYSAIAGKAK